MSQVILHTELAHRQLNVTHLSATAYGKEGVRMNFIERIFVGELTNTIMCEECGHVSECI